MNNNKKRKLVLVAIAILFIAFGILLINRVYTSIISAKEAIGENSTEVVKSDQPMSIKLLSSRELNTADKDETVYVNLNLDGSVSLINVVNHFKAQEPGVYLDFGSYESIVNLTDSSTPTIKNHEVLWEITESSKDFYYQGKLKEGELPWNLDFDYILDGEAISEDQLAGVEGELFIRFNVKENQKAEEYFRKNYMLQLTVPINLDNSTIISSLGAVQMVTGRTNMLAYTILPQTSNQFEIKLRVKDFSMESMDIAIMKANMSAFIETEEISHGFDAMSKGMGELEEGTLQFKYGMEQLSTGMNQTSSGLSQLSDGTTALNQGMEEFGQGLKTFADSLKSLEAGSQQMKDGLNNLSQNGGLLLLGYQEVEAAIGTIVELMPQLKGMAEVMLLSPDPQTKNMGQMIQAQLEGFEELEKGVQLLNSNMELYTNGVTQIASEYEGFHFGVDKIPDGYGQITGGYEEILEGNEKLYSAIGELSGGLSKINDEAAKLPSQMQLLAESQGEMKSGIDLAIEQIGSLTNKQEKEQSMVSFVAPGKTIPKSVQFILRTPAIRKAKEAKVTIETDNEKSSFWNQLLILFR